MSEFVLRDVRVVPIEAVTGPVGVVEVQDVRVRDGVVVEIAPGLPAAGVEEIAGEGRWLIPGLWDHHVHLSSWVLSKSRLELDGTTGPDEALQRIAAALPGSGRTLITRGHRISAWDRLPNLAELDAVTGDVAVVCIAGDGHHAWCNSAGLAALQVPTREDGLVYEDEWYDADPHLVALTGGTPPPSAFARVLDEAAAQGLTGIVDLEMSMSPGSWAERFDGHGPWTTDGPGRQRIRAATYLNTFEEYLDAGLRTGDPIPGAHRSIVMGPLKIISDGSLSSATAWCCEAYANVTPESFGAANLTADELAEAHGRAHGAGLEVATHAIGDAAVEQALDAYQASGARGSIEHAQLVRTEDFARIAGLGLRASVQPAHLLDDRDASESFWPGRGGRSFALRTMLDLGVTVVMGSDAPVSPLDPWLAMAAAVHRSADERPAWHGEQAISAREALAASVDGQGSVHVGMPADLALLDADPLAEFDSTADRAAHLRGIRAALTWVGGELIHDGR